MRVRKREQFEGEQKLAFDFIKSAIKDGKRTVGIFDVAMKLERENDPRWMNRMQVIFPEFVEALNRIGVMVIPVNRFCLNRYRDIAVENELEAMKCVQLRSGGAAPAGIRCVRQDDKVYQAHLRAQAELSSGAMVANIRSLKEAETLGLAERDSAMSLAGRTVKRFVDAAALQAPAQVPLLEN